MEVTLTGKLFRRPLDWLQGRAVGAEVAADVPGGLRLRVSNGKLSLFHARSLLIAIHCSDSKSPARYVGIARSLRGRRLSRSPKRAAELSDWFVPPVRSCAFSMAEHQGYANVMQDAFSRIGGPRRGALGSSRSRSSAAASALDLVLQLRASLFLSPPCFAAHPWTLELFRQCHLLISGDKYGRRVEEQRTQLIGLWLRPSSSSGRCLVLLDLRVL